LSWDTKGDSVADVNGRATIRRFYFGLGVDGCGESMTLLLKGDKRMSWNDPDKEDATIYKVIMNQEEQYSIWPAYKEVPHGCQFTGKTGLKAECLAYVKDVWTDMRPLSLRKKMEEFAKNPPPFFPAPKQTGVREKSLVDRLSEGDHPVAVGVRPEKTVKLFKDAIDHDYVHIKFTQTKGGTEIGFRLDRDASDFAGGDFENAKGTVHVEGDLTLDYVKVKCVADIDLSTLEGIGHLMKLSGGKIAAA
jgi:uncharacterized protein YbdZ (MbtH family)